MLVFTAREDTEVDRAVARNGLRAFAGTDSGVRVRQMGGADADCILELRSAVRWPADPGAFDLLRGGRGARWAVAYLRGKGLVMWMVNGDRLWRTRWRRSSVLLTAEG